MQWKYFYGWNVIFIVICSQFIWQYSPHMAGYVIITFFNGTKYFIWAFGCWTKKNELIWLFALVTYDLSIFVLFDTIYNVVHVYYVFNRFIFHARHNAPLLKLAKHKCDIIKSEWRLKVTNQMSIYLWIPFPFSLLALTRDSCQ